jgi:hypothetical protein
MAAEFSRPLLGYPYPVHDIRLLAITGCAMGFGLCLYAYTALRFGYLDRRLGRMTLAGVAALTLALIVLTRGFDGKALVAVLTPSIGAGALSIKAVFDRTVGGRLFLTILTVFCALILIAPYTFLDQNFYLAAATILLFLFMQQAYLLTEAETERAEEAARAAQLSAALDAATARLEESPPTLSLSSGSTIENVPIEEIAFCRGAGDYIEVHMMNGAERLVQKRMAEVEKCGAGLLLRVHRSYIVNLQHVRSLKRAPAGTGYLVLANGAEVPVSRRIMPAVKEKLAST